MRVSETGEESREGRRDRQKESKEGGRDKIASMISTEGGKKGEMDVCI